MQKVVEILPDLGNGGAEKLVVDIMTNVDKAKCDITLVVMFDQQDTKYYKYLQECGAKVICLHKKSGLDISMFGRMSKYLKSLQPDIIHTHRYVNMYVLPYMIRHKKQRMIHTVHSVATKELGSKYRKIMNWLYHHRDVRPVAIGGIVHDSIAKEYHLQDNQILDINNGVDLAKYASSATRQNVNNFVAVGRMTSAKNYPLMLRSFKRVLESYPDKSLTILGDGELEQDIHSLAESLGLMDNVKFAGNVPNVAEYLGAADCFVMSSDYEGLPLSMVEAMASGLPVVATKAGGVVDLVTDGEQGYLCEVGNEQDLADSIIKMINSDNIQDFSQRAIAKADEFSLDKCINEYEKVFLGD